MSPNTEAAGHRERRTRDRPTRQEVEEGARRPECEGHMSAVYPRSECGITDFIGTLPALGATHSTNPPGIGESGENIHSAMPIVRDSPSAFFTLTGRDVLFPGKLDIFENAFFLRLSLQIS